MTDVAAERENLGISYLSVGATEVSLSRRLHRPSDE
jgi:hypothetical protein